MSDYTLAGLVHYFLRLGTIGFGGPVALVGYMELDLVGRKGWISKEKFLSGIKHIKVYEEHITETDGVGVWTKADSVTAFNDFSYGHNN